MNALPERGTYRPFTEQELDRLGLPVKSIADVMACILAHICIQKKEFWPTTRENVECN